MIWLICSFLLIFLFFRTHKRNFGFRESLVLSYITCNILVYASTHLLSLARSLTARDISLFWAISFMAMSSALLISKKRGRVKIFPSLSSPLCTIELFFLSVTILFCSISLFSSVVASPYSVDALIYHLPSSMHWIQDKTIAPYPTNITRQILDPPLSGFMQLHLFLLNGNDQWVDLPQYISMVLSLVCLTLLCPLIGLTRKEALCAVSLAAALPLGVLQASSPLNDYAVSFWVISFILFLYRHLDTKSTFYIAAAAVSFASIFLTKTNGLFIATPFLIYFILSKNKHTALNKNMPVFFGIFLVFSLPFICTLAAVHPLLEKPYANSPFMNLSFSYPKWGLWENIFRHVLTEASFYKGTEMTMSNPIYLLSIIGTGIWLALKYKNIPPSVRVYALLLGVGFLLLCLTLKASLWVCRFHLPVFILFCPVIAFALLKLEHNYQRAIYLIICLSSFTMVFAAEKKTWVQRELPFRRPFYPDGVNFYLASREASLLPCPDIGLEDAGSGNQKEYILWQMMRRRSEDFRIEHVDVQNYSKYFPYPLGPFEPCAIILTKLDGDLPQHITLNKTFRILKDYGNTGLYVK